MIQILYCTRYRWSYKCH